MEAEIRKLTRKAHGDDSDEERVKKKPKKSYLEEEMAKYTKSRGVHKKSKDGKKKDEGDILAALSSFRSKLKKFDPEPEEEGQEEPEEAAHADGSGDAAAEEESMEVDDDRGFMTHKLRFSHDNAEEVIKAGRDYEVIDPRERGARAKEEERERKRILKPRDGGRGFRRERR